MRLQRLWLPTKPQLCHTAYLTCIPCIHRYAGLAREAEQERLAGVMQGLVEKDAIADKMQSITSMEVTAWHCHTCR